VGDSKPAERKSLVLKMSFIPGDLHLVQEGNGEHVLTLGSSEIMRTRSEKKAIARFKELRSEMEAKYPARELTPEERAAMFQAALAEAIVGSGTVRKRKKSTARGTRTFGG
jgi:hypothetical protein